MGLVFVIRKKLLGRLLCNDSGIQKWQMFSESDRRGILEQLTDLSATVDCLIVDGPAGLSEATRAILMRADLAVVPVQPSGVDLQSAADAVRLIKQAQLVRDGLPPAVMFLSRAVKGTKLKDEALQLLGKFSPHQKIGSETPSFYDGFTFLV
jgi:cellulose biosynthesis protein BcsQ